MQLKRTFLLLLSLLLLGASPARAAEAESTQCFTAADFSGTEEPLLGICITELSGMDCALRCGSRQISAGDVLTAEQLDTLTAAGCDRHTGTAELTFLPVYAGGPGEENVLCFTLRGSENQPPEAAEQQVETYKNLAVTESFRCSDPDGDALTFRIAKEPLKGTVTVHADGTFTYTPKEEKVGADHFTFVAADGYGLESAETRVSIDIQKANSSGVFADMTGDPNEREALFLRTEGLLSGEYVALTLCFRPEQPVSSEDFLMMAMKLTGLEPAETEEAGWFAPWEAAALRAGLPELPQEPLTRQTAAAWTAELLHGPEEQADFACFSGEADAPLTRRDAAVLLYSLHCRCRDGAITFPWQS